MSWKHISEKRVASVALLVSLATVVFASIGGPRELYKEKLYCRQNLRSDLVGLQETMGLATAKVYRCADDPKNQCEFARSYLREAFAKVENFNETKEFKKYESFEELDKNIRNAMAAVSGKALYSKLILDTAGDRLLASSSRA